MQSEVHAPCAVVPDGGRMHLEFYLVHTLQRLSAAGRRAASCTTQYHITRQRWVHILWRWEPCDSSTAIVLQENLEALFYQYGVNVIFTGHVHAYER